MSDDTARDVLLREILDAALPNVVFDGWTDLVLRKAGETLKISADEIELLFPRGGIDLLEAFSHRMDDKMAAVLEAADLPALKIRERITLAIWSRLEALQEHREASLRAASLLALPFHSVLSAKLLTRTVDAAWRGIGDTSTDFNFYTKRATLSLVYSSTLLCWISDESEDLEPTRDFLDRRINNVMQFEKTKAKVKAQFAKLPDPAEILGKMRYADPRFKDQA